MKFSITQQIMIDLINKYKWDESFPFQKMENIPIAKGTLEGCFDNNYQEVVFETYGLVLFLSDNFYSYFCLPKVAKEISSELNI